MKMKKENKKLLSILVIAIVVASAISTTITFGMKYFEEEEKGKPLLVKIFTDKDFGYPPFEINFTSMVLNYEGKVRYHWDFGDGETSTEINPKHTYQGIGTFICDLAVTDDIGKKDSDSVKISAEKNKPPMVTISINEDTIERNFIPILHAFPAYAGDKQRVINILAKTNPNIFGEGRIVCTAQVDDPENDEIVSYKWTEKTAESMVTRSGEVLQPEHCFESNESLRIPELYTWMEGRHIVTLTVEDSAGNKADASIDFQVEKSMKKVNRETKLRMIKGGLNSWIVYGNPFLGPAIALLILANWKLNNFTGVKLITLLALTFVFQLDIGTPVIMDQAKEFLVGHPMIQKKLKETLEGIQDKLEEENPDSSLIETIQKLLEDLDLANKRPILSNPKPENNHDNIDIDIQNVSITVTDPEGDPFNVTIYGDHVNYINYPLEQYNGTFNATLITPLPYDTDICWHVNVSYAQGRWVNETYMFKTRWS